MNKNQKIQAQIEILRKIIFDSINPETVNIRDIESQIYELERELEVDEQKCYFIEY